MPIERINPSDVFKPPTYSHLVKVSGGSLLFLAGQVGWDETGQVVGVNDLAAQAAQAVENIKRVLAAANATFADVVKITVYVVDYKPDKRQAIVGALVPHLTPDALPASTLLGVQALARPELMIEIDVVAFVQD